MKMMMMDTSFLCPQPPSLLINGMSVVSLAALANAGLSELRGKHLKYSKFYAKSAAKDPIGISSRNGMLWLYTPAFVAAAASFYIFPSNDLRLLMLKSALALHFLKRILEVIFIHKYSGGMTLEAVIPITLSYFTSTALMLYTQHLSLGLPEPVFDLKYPGFLLFVIGIVGNLYHHCLLSKLRRTGGKEYKIPEGGLFDKVICPHYLFEILVFWGFFFISQTIYALSFAIGTTFYLMGRSYATRRWYISKFEGFPRRIKALVPFVF